MRWHDFTVTVRFIETGVESRVTVRALSKADALWRAVNRRLDGRSQRSRCWSNGRATSPPSPPTTQPPAACCLCLASWPRWTRWQSATTRSLVRLEIRSCTERRAACSRKRELQKAGRLRTGRYAAWWDLHLECGHSATRDVRYDARLDAATGRWRGKEERALPHPRHVQCCRCEPVP